MTRGPKDRPRKSPSGKPASGVAALASAQKARDAAGAGADDDLDALAKSNDVDDLDAFGPSGAPDGYSVLAALADAALAEALPGRLRARLKAGQPIAVVVAVPDASWVGPVADAVKRLAPTAKCCPRDGSLRGQHKPSYGNPETALALADGRAVVGVAAAPEAVLPSALVACADARVALAPPSGRALRRILRRFMRAPTPQGLGSAPCAGLTFDEIVASFRAGATARAVLAAFARAAASKSSPGPADATPTLDALPGFSGEARAWGEALAEAFALYRAGVVPWSALLSASAAVIAGPPGTGKTVFAKSLARSLNVPLVVTSVGSWFASSDGHLGDVIKAMQTAWDAARASAPAVFFADELDALPSRSTLSAHGRDWWSPVIAHALTLFDGAATDRTGIVLLGATNFGDRLDDALVRPGRFERIIQVGLPTDVDLAEIVEWHLGGALDMADLLPVVRLGAGATAAMAAMWAREAAALARRSRRAVSVADVLAAVAPPDVRSPDDLRRAAVHEAGHCVAALATGRGAASASIVAVGSSGGLTTLGPAPSTMPTAEQYDDAIVVALAARAAEDVLFGGPSAASEADLAQATGMAAAMLASTGLAGGLAFLAPSAEALALVQGDPALRRQVERRLARLYAEARTLIEGRRREVEAVASALVQRRMLSGAEIEALAAGAAGRARRSARTRTGGGHEA